MPPTPSNRHCEDAALSAPFATGQPGGLPGPAPAEGGVAVTGTAPDAYAAPRKGPALAWTCRCRSGYPRGNPMRALSDRGCSTPT
ncbi:hypothetical protein SAM23877_0817 [Streptomyces ambofaciens ATCC 23877]|uniref:Uncharacterized protein n=1 Tax=Streptomyces ambofaciens (strain ATCC 23877 / 3486 / DSM 40053 / JCM 4204 / NBRC 12836 / NRRL B-2516) TaxID=278992 RepID=A0A0K2ALS5_STRA7|nr:hypothetical protein SAM23877_0817 [Streptomyces ambofaciens ATCC 23877]